MTEKTRYDWNLGEIRNTDEVCWEHIQLSEPGLSPSRCSLGWKVDPSNELLLYRLTPKLSAIIAASYEMGTPWLADVPYSQQEWAFRLELMFAVGVSFLETSTPEGSVPLPIYKSDLMRFIGLRTGAQKKNGKEFFDYLRGRWRDG